MPFYLRPSAPTAADGLICGDPARALAIAQHIMVQPRISNHNRGLWSYYGETLEGMPLTVQSTGIGGPSAAAVLAEAFELGLRRVVRVGTCAAPIGIPALGDRLVVSLAIGADGTSRTLNGRTEDPIEPDQTLTAALIAITGAPSTTVRSVDLIGEDLGDSDSPANSVVDLQSAAVLSICSRFGIPAAAALVVASSAGRRLDDDPLDAALLRLATAATGAIAKSRPLSEG